MLNVHAVERVSERLTNVGLDPEEVKALALGVSRRIPSGSAAVRLYSLGDHKGPSDVDHYAREKSNGDEVWCIVRDGDVVTVMFRRSDQPRTPEALRVDKVLRVN